MDCCGGEGAHGDARFELTRVADGVHAAVAAPAYKVNWRTGLLANIERTYAIVS